MADVFRHAIIVFVAKTTTSTFTSFLLRFHALGLPLYPWMLQSYIRYGKGQSLWPCRMQAGGAAARLPRQRFLRPDLHGVSKLSSSGKTRGQCYDASGVQ